MPSNPCPHCPLKFLNRALLQTHIAFVHDGGPQYAATPPTTPSQSGFSAQTQDAAGSSTTAPLPTSVPPPHHPPASSSTFTIQLDTGIFAPHTLIHIPITEPFADFMHRLSTLSAPIVGAVWRYTLVGHDGARGEARRLDRNLFYLAMVSELRRMGSPYAYAVVWFNAQDSIPTTLGGEQLESGQGRGSGGGGGAAMAVGQAAMGRGQYQMEMGQVQQGPGQARTPWGIRQRREEGGRVMYLVGFVEGGPERWMGGEELRGGGAGELVEEWEGGYVVG